MFFVRTIAGIVLLLLAFFFVNSGGILLLGISMIISVIGTFELYRVFKIEDKIIGFTGYLSVIAYYLSTYLYGDKYHLFLFALILMIMMTVYVFTFPQIKIDEVAKAFLGFIYVGVLMSFLYQTRKLSDGKFLAWLIFISSWGSDTCAYAVGSLMGKHKFAPVLSPKKSIEGAVGGVLGSAFLGFLFGFLLSARMREVSNPALICALASAIGAVISQIGDLVASGIKRNYNVKDFGNLIPGHGGIIDRFDGMFFTAPAVFFAIKFLV